MWEGAWRKIASSKSVTPDLEPVSAMSAAARFAVYAAIVRRHHLPRSSGGTTSDPAYHSLVNHRGSSPVRPRLTPPISVHQIQHGVNAFIFGRRCKFDPCGEENSVCSILGLVRGCATVKKHHLQGTFRVRQDVLSGRRARDRDMKNRKIWPFCDISYWWVLLSCREIHA